MSDDFNFFVPMDIAKSQSNSEDEWRIAGYASCSDEDRQGDEIIQKGLDFSDFVNYGWLNYDHDNSKILGYPDKSKCKIDGKGFYIEGTLIKGVELAKTVWETAVALEKSNAPRRLGFSIEGKTLKRNDLGQIVKAKIYNVAITANPVNPKCNFQALCKSFTNNEKDFEDNLDKSEALDAGHGDGKGSPIVPESLESAFKTLSYAVGNDEESKKYMNMLKSKLCGRTDITKSELILYLQLSKGLSLDKSNLIADKLLKGE